MTVFLVMEEYENGVDAWHTVVEVFSNEDQAELRAVQLELEKNEAGYSYYVDKMEVKDTI